MKNECLNPKNIFYNCLKHTVSDDMDATVEIILDNGLQEERRSIFQYQKELRNFITQESFFFVEHLDKNCLSYPLNVCNYKCSLEEWSRIHN